MTANQPGGTVRDQRFQPARKFSAFVIWERRYLSEGRFASLEPVGTHSTAFLINLREERDADVPTNHSRMRP